MLNTAALFPMFFFLTLYTQDVLGYTAVESGLAQLPLAATIAASATLAPRVIATAGPRSSLLAGLLLLAGGLLWLAQVPADGTFVVHLLLPSLVVGIGEGAIWVSSMVVATNGASEAESGLASGLVNTSQQLGGSLGIAGLVALASARTSDGGVMEGFSAGFTGGAVIAGLGALLAAALLASGSPREPAAAGAAA